MKIKSVHIEKYKGLKDFKIDFNNSVNVIIGENGLGKTTILQLIYDMIIGNDDIVDENDFKECSTKILFNDEELKIIKELSGENYKNNEKFVLNREGFNKNIYFIQCGSSKNKSCNENWVNKVVYLPTDVNFKKYKVETPKNIEKDAKVGVILNSDEMSLSLKEYLVNMHYQDLEDMSIGEKPYRIEKFKKLYNSFFEDKEFIGVRKFEPSFKVKATGETHSVDDLSSGEKQIFFRGGSLLEMNLKNSIILIDEPELSLHPEWQQKILDFYKEIGENNQIIIATHSPHIVSSCKKEEVIVLGRNNEGKTVVRKDIEETYGWAVEQLLLSVFELKSVRNPQVQTKLDKFKNFYINKYRLNDNEIKEFNDLKLELEKYLDPEDPSLSLINIKEDSKKLESLLEKLKGNRK